jgi:hypothetical protein
MQIVFLKKKLVGCNSVAHRYQGNPHVSIFTIPKPHFPVTTPGMLGKRAGTRNLLYEQNSGTPSIQKRTLEKTSYLWN